MDAGETVVLDGRLDEGVWMRAVPATNFIQQDPSTANLPRADGSQNRLQRRQTIPGRHLLRFGGARVGRIG